MYFVAIRLNAIFEKMNTILKLITVILLLSVGNVRAQVPGCTDPLATNYNAGATQNDGSCVYGAASVTPLSSFNITSNLIETSGLLKWNDQLWSHNDNADTYLYTLDTIDGSLQQVYNLTGTVNTDWEEITDDSNYIYVGDFGNSLNGNRTGLKILRVEKNSLLASAPVIDTINFSYADQINFNPAGSNNTDFDCEAFVVTTDSIYLFNKQWITHKTSLYVLPKVPGTYVAYNKATLDVQGLITGSVSLPDKHLTVLCGYSSVLQPFFYLLYDYTGTDYFGGNKRKIDISLPFHQVEGVASTDGLKYYITNESLVQGPLNIPQKLHILDLSSYLSGYINSLTGIPEISDQNTFFVFPNPTDDFVNVKSDYFPTEYFLMDNLGRIVLKGKIDHPLSTIDLRGVSGGLYSLKLESDRNLFYKIVKK